MLVKTSHGRILRIGHISSRPDLVMPMDLDVYGLESEADNLRNTPSFKSNNSVSKRQVLWRWASDEAAGVRIDWKM